ncbi:hypothetical protein NQ318_020282 [Aromia moschata]|uniref:N-acetyltransferase domain-containing protein n=1 Tax=Aromia moschata TaxID=1265417 RepID=A0AAV8Z9Y4_9CUCU|nr:hypothetical protein NQ318_020282 [Aromia moschata]
MLKCQEFNITVRKAKREDMIQVYKLVKDITARRSFDTESPAFTCIVAELSDGHIVGYALYYYSYSTWVGKSILLEDIYVQPAYRRNGIGRQLFMAVVKIAHDSKIRRMDFHVLSWNPAVDFYKRLGAVNLTVTDKWHIFRMDHRCIQRLFP